MTSQPCYQPSPKVFSVIGSQFIDPNPFEVIFVRNLNGDHLITDVNHNIIFKVIRRSTSYHEQRLLLDADDIPIVLICKQRFSTHNGWKVYKGYSTADSDIIFSSKTPKIIFSKTNVHVFLANKKDGKDSCDFKITGNWSKRSCTIYTGNTSTIIAQMHKMEVEPSENVMDKFMLKICPHVDYAFVVTLIVIVEAMKGSDTKNDNVDQVVNGGMGLMFIAQCIAAIFT